MSKRADSDDRTLFGEAAILIRAERYAEALAIYRQLAEAGYDDAQTYLGWLYSKGLGTTRNDSEALVWLEKAVSAGNPRAAYLAGRIIETTDVTSSIAKYERAASREYAPALSRLGIAYLEGKAVTQDVMKGLGYLYRAAAQRHYYALRALAIYQMSHGSMSEKLRGAISFVGATWAAIRTLKSNRYSDTLTW